MNIKLTSLLKKITTRQWFPPALLLIVAVLLSAIFLWRVFEEGKKHLQSEMAVMMIAKRDEAGEWLRRLHGELVQPPSGFMASLVKEILTQPLTTERMEKIKARLANYQQRTYGIGQIALYDSQGKYLLSLFDGDGVALKKDAFNELLAQQKSSVNAVQDCSLPQGQACYAVGAPLFEKDGNKTEHLGYVVITIDLERTLLPIIKKRHGSEIKAGFYLYRGEAAFNVKQTADVRFSLPLDGLSAADIRRAKSGEILKVQERDGQAVFAMAEKVNAVDWWVLAAVGYDEALAQTYKDLYSFSAFLLLLIGSGFLIVRYWLQVQVNSVSLQGKRKELQFLQDYIDHLPAIAFIKDSAGRVLMANLGFERYLGLPRDEMIGKRGSDYFPGALGLKLETDDRRILASGLTEKMEEVVAGNIYETTKFVLTDGEGDCLLGGISIDVTERVRSARRNQTMLRIGELATVLTEKDFVSYSLELLQELTGSQVGFLHFVNEDQESIELVTWTGSALRSCEDIFDRHYPINQAGIWADCIRQMRPVIFNDYTASQRERGLPEGRIKLQRLISVPVMENSKIRMIAGVGDKDTDYSDWDIETLQLISNQLWSYVQRARSEMSLRKAAQVIESSQTVFFRWRAEPNWPVEHVSANVNRWGYSVEDLIEGRLHFSAMIHPDDCERVAGEVETFTNEGRETYSQEYRLLSSDGQIVWVEDRTNVERDANGKATMFNGLLTDISERKRFEQNLCQQLEALNRLNKKLEEAQAQLVQAEKLAAIGQLAAGVAHELNNPIGFVHSNLGTLTDYVRTMISICDACPVGALGDIDCPHSSEVNKIKADEDYDYIRRDVFSLLDESRDGLQRVRKIVLDLRDFSRSGSQDWEWANIHAGLESTLNIVNNELKYKCTIVKEFSDIPEIFCVMSQLNQVFMNLLVNAAQAIEEKGEIILRTGLDGTESIWVSISDTGQGISQENINRIFEPFFTTKPIGTGTGLGLSLVYSIIQKHHGKITVESVQGAGTTFRIVLPIHFLENGESQGKVPA